MNAMEAEPYQPAPAPSGATIDWESFYRDYRKPGYIPGFEVVNKLGGGVFGIVYKARKESIGKDYAIKFLKVDDEVVRDAVVRELDSVRFFAQIDHPNLVSIEDKGEVDGIPYIVMSYAGQETLRKRLDEDRLDHDEALRIFIQAARGVQALHEHSLVHFDLKPANIFLKGDIARVGDYGLSKLVTQSRNSLSFGRGTPYYMAPEMLKRRGDVRSDVYSLGIILYECLVGDVPFRGDSEWEVLKKHESEPPTLPPGLGPVERGVITRCLAKDPEDRFQTVKELLHALQAPASLGESLVLPASATTASRPDPRPQEEPPPIPRSAKPVARSPRPEPDRTIAATATARTPRADEPRGLIGGIVHLVFQVFQAAILAVLVPARLLSIALGRGLGFLIRLPGKALSALLAIAGYLVVAFSIIMLLILLLRLVQ
jgi:serine/threonine protein kinase